MKSFGVADVQAKTFFDEHGWVLIDTLDDEGVIILRRWIEEISTWRDEDGPWLHYREMTDFGVKLCRTENFTPFHDGLCRLLTSGIMLQSASVLMGEKAILYKEKINYKLVGGAGYAPHQDAPAYPFVQTHISCMVAIDDSSVENGCLEVVDNCYSALLAMNDLGCITDDFVESLQWIYVPLKSGQTLWFHSRTPHRSGPNNSLSDRRAIYPTYNALSQGNLRDAYYAQKLRQMAQHQVGDKVQVSLIGDFQGRPVQD